MAIPGEGRKQDRPSGELLLDRQLPVFDANQVSTIVVDAATEQTYSAVRPSTRTRCRSLSR